MAYASVRIKEIIDRSVEHDWSIPEFQRGFVWKTTQVRDLIESLWLSYPVGTLLIWNSGAGIEGRGPSDARPPHHWVVDGQQRATAFCILSGRKPYWWKSQEEWEKTLRKFDIRFDIHAKEAPYFVVANAATRKVKGLRYIPISKLLNLDTSKDEHQAALQEMARQVKVDGYCDGMDAMEVFTRLDRLRKIRDQEIVTITVDNELEEVVEIFARLNSRGTRVREADIYLGVVAARSPGWVRDEFLPYIDQLSDAGFEVTPNLLFRTLTAISTKRVRYKYVDDAFWDPGNVRPAWERAKKAWAKAIKGFRQYGVHGNSLLPADNALVTTLALIDKFPDEPFDPLFYWFLQVSRFGRYSTSSETTMEEDLRAIEESAAFNSALERLLSRLRYVPPIQREDFLRDYGDSRFGRLLLYLLVYGNEASDWDQTGHRIGFDETEILAGFRPQFHHIFPRKFLEENKVGSSEADALANIAVIGPSINIRINKKDPLDYIPRYGITPEKLQQQFISSDVPKMTIGNYPAWVEARSGVLAREANRYLEALRGGLTLPEVAKEDEQEHAYDAA